MSLFPDLNKWWEYDPDEIMSVVYWAQDQLPPSKVKYPEKYEKNWNNIKRQLIEKYGDGGEQ